MYHRRTISPLRWLCGVFLLVTTGLLSAETITVSGTYVDRQAAPIPEAQVHFYRDGTLQDSTRTDSTGHFTVSLTVVGVTSDPAIIQSPQLWQNYPNPFNPSTRFPLLIDAPGTVTIYNLRGQVVDQVRLDAPGAYTLTWGGGTHAGSRVSSGLYFYRLQTRHRSITRKMILLDNGTGAPLSVTAFQSMTSLGDHPLGKTTANTDSLVFRKTHTSTLSYPLAPVQADTSLGTITGNVGPTLQSNIPWQTITTWDTLRLNLNRYISNDDATRYLSDDPGVMLQDSLLWFQPTEPGNQVVHITAIDVRDTTLRTALVCPVQVYDVPFWFEVPDQTLSEDDTATTLIADLQEYVQILVSGSVDTTQLTYTIDSQSRPDLITLAIDGRRMVIESLAPEPDPIQVQLIPLRTAVSEDTAGLPLPIATMRVTTEDNIGSLTQSVDVIGGEASLALQDSTVLLTALGANFNGAVTYRAIASNGTLSDTATGTLTILPVNDPPVQVADIPDITFPEDSVYRLPLRPDYIQDIDSPTLQYEVSRIPTGDPDIESSFAGDTLVIRGTPDWFGTVLSISIHIYDMPNSLGTNSFSVTVTPRPDPPVIQLQTLQTSIEEDATNLPLALATVHISDPDSNETRTTTLETGNNNITLSLQDTTVLLTALAPDFNGSVDYQVIVNDGTFSDTASSQVTVTPVDDPPVQVADIPDITLPEDSLYRLALRPDYIQDIDSPTLQYEVSRIPTGDPDIQSTFTGDTLVLTPAPNWNGTISDFSIHVWDGDNSLGTNTFAVTVTPQPDPPTVQLTAQRTRVGEDTTGLPIPVATVQVSDPDGNETLTTTLASAADSVTLVLQDSTVLLTALAPDYHGEVPYQVIASDGVYSDTVHSTLTVTPKADITFQLMSVYPDTLVTMPGGAFTIGSDTYPAQAGTLRIQLDAGTYAFNATHDSSIDGEGANNREYLFIKTPGVQGNLEQRAYDDHSSPITFGTTDDTVYAYKIMNNYNMYIIKSYLDQNTIGIRRFARGLDVPFWWDDNYLPSDSSDWGDPVQWTYDVMEQLSEIPHCDITMHFEESTQTPTTPYLTMKVGDEFPSPGSNSTDYDEATNEIILARARYPAWPGEHTWKAEIYEAVANLSDVGGISPHIYELDDQGRIMLNETGKQLFALYFIADPGTKL